jgi:hypothetical protein
MSSLCYTLFVHDYNHLLDSLVPQFGLVSDVEYTSGANGWHLSTGEAMFVLASIMVS